MEIVKMGYQNFADMNKVNQPFEIIGKIKPAFSDGVWSYAEEIYGQSYRKEYAGDFWDCDGYVDSSDKAVFLAYSGGECVGQVVLRRDWNGYGFVEDICVARSVRGQGVGTGLMDRAVVWAKNLGLNGLALETQDNNLLACRFYVKCGFVIGGVDTMFYRNLGNKEEFAVFWYLQF